MGQLTALTYPDGHQALYSYSHGAVSGITFALGSTRLTAASGVAWQPMDAALARWTSSNGLTNTLSYDTDGRLVGIAVPGVESLGFSYAAANRLTCPSSITIVDGAGSRAGLQAGIRVAIMCSM